MHDPPLRRSEVGEADAALARPAAVAPAIGAGTPAATILALQRSAGNHAVTGLLGRDDAFTLARSGPSAEVPHRQAMEGAFGTGFGDVRARLGGAAAEQGLAALGARAATSGNDVVFRDRDPSPDLVAHELAHVVQQRRGVEGVMASSASGPGPGSAAERAADAAADAVTRGAAVPDVGTAAAGSVQLAPVRTSGGEWETTTYTAASGGDLGANIDLKFTPKDPVIADNIGLTQTVNTQKSATAGGPVTTPSSVSGRNAALSLPAAGSDPGRAVDQGDPTGDTVPNTNPLYAVENSPGKVSATLTDVAPTAGFGSHASRKRNGAGGFDENPGNLKDGPRRGLEFAGQEWRQSFEATALALDGPLANMYLGSVAWGWKTDDKGVTTLDPDPIKVVREGPPTAAFMDAARTWNAATFTDPSTGTTHDTVDLPIETVDPGALSTADLATRLADVRKQAASLAGDAKSRKDFEALGLERELKTRNVKVRVKVKGTEDWFADEVYVKARGPSHPQDADEEAGRRRRAHVRRAAHRALGKPPPGRPRQDRGVRRGLARRRRPHRDDVVGCAVRLAEELGFPGRRRLRRRGLVRAVRPAARSSGARPPAISVSGWRRPGASSTCTSRTSAAGRSRC